MTSSFLPRFRRECARIVSLEPAAEAKARQHLDSLTKPRGSLGRLEDAAARLYAIQRAAPIAARPARMVTIAADHGVVAEGVASSPQAVTRLMVQNFLNGGAAINSLCAATGADLRVVDAGVACEPFAPHPLLIDAKIARGTANMALGPAMSENECLRALHLGLDLAARAHEDGVAVLGTGEMGIGNTTASSALFCACLGFSPREVTGMGAGVPQAGLAHKSSVISRALAVNAAAVKSGDPLAVLAALGGLEIAALAGLVLGAAARRMAVVIDGFISTAAFVVAERCAPAVRGYCFFSHGSAEAGHGRVLEKLQEKPLLDLGMRLGEGTGAALAFHLLEAAARVYNNMATFESAGISLE
jgi:nicotinate-nucleotide--dimethylbenzimidazole phosphoribosyltransferase